VRGRASCTDAELGHVRNPFLVGGIRFELALEQVRGDEALLASVPAVVFLEDLRNSGLQGRPWIRALKTGLVIEECGPGQPGHLQEKVHPLLSLESDDSANL